MAVVNLACPILFDTCKEDYRVCPDTTPFTTLNTPASMISGLLMGQSWRPRLQFVCCQAGIGSPRGPSTVLLIVVVLSILYVTDELNVCPVVLN